MKVVAAFYTEKFGLLSQELLSFILSPNLFEVKKTILATKGIEICLAWYYFKTTKFREIVVENL